MSPKVPLNPTGRKLVNNEAALFRTIGEGLDVPMVYNILKRHRYPVYPSQWHPARSFTGSRKPVVGRALTMTISTALDHSADVTANSPVSREHYWEAVLQASGSTVLVCHDTEAHERESGSFWGEMQVAVLSNRIAGVVTDGSVRDLPFLESSGIAWLHSGPTVGNGNLTIWQVNTQLVQVGRMQVLPNDVVMMDQHGAIKIPEAILPDLLKLAEDLERREKIFTTAARQTMATPASLRAALNAMNAK